MGSNELMFPGSNSSNNKPGPRKDNNIAPERKKNAPSVDQRQKTVVENKFDFNDELSRTRPFNAGSVKTKRTEEVDDYIAKKRAKRKKRNRVLLRCGMGLLGLVIGIFCFLLWYKHYLMSQITFIEPEQNATIINDEGEVVEISRLREEYKPDIPVIEDESIHNFLLIGIDSRSKSYTTDGKGGLADVIMIMSINNNSGDIKLMSIARDSYVNVPGYKRPMKINAAMSQGGPDLLQLTIENTLRLEIEGYAYVNFYNMSKVIDAVGGVYCNVTGGEQKYLNEHLKEVNKISGYAEDYQQVSSTGDVWLNGRQAVAYARIRYIDSDYKRSERQVEVLRSIMSQFMGMNIAKKGACLDDVLSLIVTNIPQDEIEDLALDYLPSLKNANIKYFQLPLEGFYNSGMYGDEWSIRNNWNETIPYVQLFFYGETKEFDPVDEIPNQKVDCPDDFDWEGHIQG